MINMKGIISASFILSVLLSVPGMVYSASIKPETYGPKEGMDFLHGVMMHNDETAGDDHKVEDTYVRLQAEDAEKKAKEKGVGPCQGEDCMHELMHEEKEGVAHMNQKPDVEQEEKVPGPQDAMEALHGVLMHGDDEAGKNHGKHHEQMKHDKSEGKEPSVKDAMDALHGVLMHGDEAPGDDHTDEDAHKVEAEKDHPPPGVQDAHQFMHESEEDTDHIHDDRPRMDVGPRGVPSVSDPHEAIHGDLDTQMKTVTEDEESGGAKMGREGDTGFLGFSFPFISDTFMDEIDLLKKKWLPKYWNEDDEPNTDETDHSQKTQNVEGGDTDLMHDLAGVGDTAPNAEHNGHSHTSNEDQKQPAASSTSKHDES